MDLSWNSWSSAQPLHILTLCGSELVVVAPTEPLDDLSCLTTPGGRLSRRRAVARAIDPVHPDAPSESMRGFADSSIDLRRCVHLQDKFPDRGFQQRGVGVGGCRLQRQHTAIQQRVRGPAGSSGAGTYQTSKNPMPKPRIRLRLPQEHIQGAMIPASHENTTPPHNATPHRCTIALGSVHAPKKRGCQMQPKSGGTSCSGLRLIQQCSLRWLQWGKTRVWPTSLWCSPACAAPVGYPPFLPPCSWSCRSPAPSRGGGGAPKGSRAQPAYALFQPQQLKNGNFRNSVVLSSSIFCS